MALIQYTEPDAHMQTSGQAMLGQNEMGQQYPLLRPDAEANGYGMVGTGVTLASTDQSGQVSLELDSRASLTSISLLQRY